MSNRIFLYLTAGPSEGAPSIEVAAAAHALAPLWQVLLAGARPTGAIADQRVFGDAGTPNIGVRVQEGIERLRRLRDLVADDPFRDEFGDALGRGADAAGAGAVSEGGWAS